MKKHEAESGGEEFAGTEDSGGHEPADLLMTGLKVLGITFLAALLLPFLIPLVAIVGGLGLGLLGLALGLVLGFLGVVLKLVLVVLKVALGLVGLALSLLPVILCVLGVLFLVEHLREDDD